MKSKAGYVSVIGKPNAGKSSLINAFLNFKLSAVNKKAQTTRIRILGILSEKNYQIVFIDTPGLLEPQYELQKYMLSEIISSLEESDILIQLFDVTKPDKEIFRSFESKYEKLLKKKFRLIVLNKIDLLKKNELLPVIQKISEYYRDIEIVPVSALKGENIDELKKLIVNHLPENKFFFEEDTLTDKSEKFFSEEIIRENILSLYHEEVPYSSVVKIAEFKERSETLVYINAEIILERESQKAIIIGKKGEGLKRLGEKARKDLEKFLGKKVYLSLFIKVKKEWRNNKNFIRNNFSQ